jgi:hypothetical protein
VEELEMGRAQESTVIKNICGARENFTWIPPHGLWLEDQQIFVVKGLLETQLRTGTNKSKLRAFLNDVRDKKVLIFYTDGSIPSEDFHEVERKRDGIEVKNSQSATLNRE